MKRKISFIMILVLCTGIAASALALGTASADQPSGWSSESVNAAIAEGLVPQELQSKYTQPVTRAEFCALVVALYETITGGEITGRTELDDTADVNVEKAASIKVVQGVGGNKFAPDANLDRQQAATVLSRLADAIEKPLPSINADFADNSKIAPWAISAVGRIQAAGIMQGMGGNTFAPLDTFTREQCIVTIMRLYKDYEVLYADDYALAYAINGAMNVYSKYFGHDGAVLKYGEEAPPDWTDFGGRWHYTPHGDFIIGGYIGDMAFMPSYRYKDDVFEQVFHKEKLLDIRFAGDYLYMVFGRSISDYFWDASKSSNLLQISLIDFSENYLGAPGFVYGWSEEMIPAPGGGSTYDPEKMKWEVREDGIHIFGFIKSPDNNEDEATSEESGFYLVSLEGNGHQRID